MSTDGGILSPGRNQLCPCGSGKKYKRCCVGKFSPNNPIAVVFDKRRNTLIVASADMLLNQLRRDGPKIARSFDHYYEDDLRALSAEVSRVLTHLSAGRMQASSGIEPQFSSATLLTNATQTICAAVSLVREGYYLQAPILLRNAVEAIATSVAIHTDARTLKRYQEGNLVSTKCITPANRVLPIVGRIYGMLSEQFAHLGALHFDPHSPKELSAREEAPDGILNMVRSVVVLLDMAVELIFFNIIPNPRYWEAAGSGAFRYKPSPEDTDRFMGFVGASEKGSDNSPKGSA